MHVYLIHGMGRTPLSMWLLERRLRARGYRTSRFGYMVTLSSLDEIADRFVEHVLETQENGPDASYAVVGHSLGNVIARLASPRLPAGFSRFVMLAPPNSSPRLARALEGNMLYKAVTRDAGRKLADEEFFSSLPVPEAPALIIAGTRGPRAHSLLPFSDANDLLLAVTETRMPDVPVIEVHGFHTFLMNRADVLDAIDRFLKHAHPSADYLEGKGRREGIDSEDRPHLSAPPS